MLDINSQINKQIYLKSSPKDKLTKENFELKESKINHLDNNQVLVEVIYISIDAANRAWMQGRTYRRKNIDGNFRGSEDIFFKKVRDGFIEFLRSPFK